jgi:hypothetical protein
MNTFSKIKESNRAENLRSKSSKQMDLSVIRRLSSWSLKLFISTAAIWYIVSKLQNSVVGLELQAFSFSSFSKIHLTALGSLVLVVMAVNWGIEVLKWKWLVETQFSIRWTTAVKGVLSGVTVGVFSPNRIGEFIGRILALSPERRVKASLLAFVNGLSQTMATVTFGVGGMIFLLSRIGEQALGILPTLIFQVVLFLFFLTTLFLYLRIELFSTILLKIKFLKKYKRHLDVFSEIPSAMLHQLYLLSLFRFSTFLAQYLIVFYLLLESTDWWAIGGASALTLFSTTLVPFLPVPEILLRESMALSYFQLFDVDLAMVTYAVLFVWTINVAIPALIGACVLFTYRIFKPR